jgi:cysteinyl-tRNA synthetase
LNGHYRQPLDWSDQLLTEMKRKLDRLYGTLRDIDGWQSVWQATEPDPAFVAALEDDLNTPKALAALFDLSHAANRSESSEVQVRAAAQLRASADWMGLLSVEPEQWFTAGSDAMLDNVAIDQLLAERNAARAQKDFAAADRIRDELAAQGISIEDGAGGTRWRRN